VIPTGGRTCGEPHVDGIPFDILRFDIRQSAVFSRAVFVVNFVVNFVDKARDKV
jgi:hypothetical protein